MSTLFERTATGFMPTDLALGPWDRNALHGGAVAALMVDGQCNTAGVGRLTRFSLELLRPVPRAELTLTVRVARSGRQVQRSEAELRAGGQVLARSEGLHLSPAEPPLPSLDPLHMRRTTDVQPDPPEAGEAPQDIGTGRRVTFARNAVEISVVSGAFTSLGPSVAWFRLACSVVDDEPVVPWARVVAAADFSNGLSAVVPWGKFVFANADLVIATPREPEGEWVAIACVTQAANDGVAVAHSQLWDRAGMLGITSQTVAIRGR